MQLTAVRNATQQLNNNYITESKDNMKNNKIKSFDNINRRNIVKESPNSTIKNKI